MYAVQSIDGKGNLELNWTHLPTWIGINGPLKKELETRLEKELIGLELTPAGLLMAHRLVVDFLVAKAPHVKGLRAQLDVLLEMEIA